MLLEVIRDACYQWCFWARDEEIEVVVLGVLDECWEVCLGDGGDVLALWDTAFCQCKAIGGIQRFSLLPRDAYLPSGATIPGHYMYALNAVALGELPSQCVFPAAIAYEQDA